MIAKLDTYYVLRDGVSDSAVFASCTSAWDSDPVMAGNSVVLESLDAGGYYDPIVLAPLGSGQPTLIQTWPVAGVLFERPD